MRKIIDVVLTICLTAASLPAFADDQGPQSWVCLGEHATGIAPDAKTHQWREQLATLRKYIVTRVHDKILNQKFPYEVRRFGAPETAVLAFCEGDFDNKIGDIECSQGIGIRFLFNRITLRFTQISAPAGYINYDAPTVGETPPSYLEIGTCSPV